MLSISDYSPALSGSLGIFPLPKNVGVSPLNMDENGISGSTEIRSLYANKMDDS